MKPVSFVLILSVFLLIPASVQAQSKLLATGGATQLEGAAGGGIVPWAVISGYGDTGEWGVGAAYTRVGVEDFELDVTGLNVSFDNRIELSFSRQKLEVKPLNLEIEQDIIGTKLLLGGDLVYGSVPQVSLGMQYKKNRDFAVPASLGADADSSFDIYLATTRLWLDAILGRNVVANGTLRWTEANQAGLLGFGDADGQAYSLQVEASVGIFLNRHWALGMEYRQKPNNIDGVREQDWYDVFVAWFPNKHVALVAAYSDLGDIAGLRDQSGWYLSVQLTQ